MIVTDRFGFVVYCNVIDRMGMVCLFVPIFKFDFIRVFMPFQSAYRHDILILLLLSVLCVCLQTIKHFS